MKTATITPPILGKVRKGIEDPLKIIHFLIRTVEDYRIERNPSVIEGYSEGGPNWRGRALVFFLTEPFYYFDCSPRFQLHQNKWQAIELANSVSRLGYTVDIYPIWNEPPSSMDEYDLVLGRGDNYHRTVEGSDSRAIYFGTGQSVPTLREKETERLRNLEARHGIKLPPERSREHRGTPKSYENVIVLGDERTAQTYRDLAPDASSIYPIRLNYRPNFSSTIESKNFEDARRSVVWFGGHGLVLKGLDLALEAFEGLDGIDLYVCGPVANNEEFSEHYHDLLYDTENIHTRGWVRVGSREFTEIMSEAGYLLYPSASDGFPSGSIAACMHAGLVPILSPEIVHDTDGWGFTLDDVTVPGIRSQLRRCAELDPASLRAMSQAALEKARSDFTRQAYSTDLEDALRRIVSD